MAEAKVSEGMVRVVRKGESKVAEALVPLARGRGVAMMLWC